MALKTNATFLFRKWLLLTTGLAIGCIAPSLAVGGPNAYLQHNLTSNIPGLADNTDPNLVDAWGLSTNFWVGDHLTGLSTVYSAAGVPSATVVTVPGGAGSASPSRPTGVTGNPTTGFLLANGNKASFIFCTEDGAISAWNSGTVATRFVDNSSTSAVYKGLTTSTGTGAPLLYAANFRAGTIDVFDTAFKPTTVSGGFKDPNLPAGVAPFNVWTLNGKVYVTYAKQDANKFLDVAGAGNGIVNVFDFNGTLLSRLVSNGALNSPWGMTIAPANWGAFGGALLVANFGDGAINAFDANTGAQLGTLQDASGNPIAISGIWGLLFGTAPRSDPNTLYFAAGMPNGTTAKRGLFGSVAPPSAVSAIYNSAGGQATAIAPGEIIGITGQTVGTSPSVSAVLGLTGTVGAALGGTSVTINNIPAPILYTSSIQTSVIVPYGVAGSTTASIVVKTGGQTTAVFSVPVANSVPGVFTLTGSGSGAAVVINQDGTVNSATNAAGKGSVVVLYATGEGVTNPPGVDGLISSTDILREPVLPVSLTIGGIAAPVLYAGSAPGNVAGVMEVEAIVPVTAASGAAPVLLTVGTVVSQANVTLSVK